MRDPDDQQDTSNDTMTMFAEIWSRSLYASVCCFFALFISVQCIEHLQTGHSDRAQKWNERRKEALRHCMEKILYPTFAKELREKLLEEARQTAIRVRFDFCIIGHYSSLFVAGNRLQFFHALRVHSSIPATEQRVRRG